MIKENKAFLAATKKVYLGEARGSINSLNDAHFVWESFQHSTQIKHFQKFCWAYVTVWYCELSKWPFIVKKKSLYI